jgi:hypothetical protein
MRQLRLAIGQAFLQTRDRIVHGSLVCNDLSGVELWRNLNAGVGALVALALVFFVSTAVRWLPPVRWAVMKPGRSPDEILPALRLLMLVSGFLLAMFILQLFMGPTAPR